MSGLYQRWRQYPTLIQTLEAEYSRRQWTEEETLLGRLKSRPAAKSEAEEPTAAEEEPAERAGGLLAPYLENQAQYALLAQMLAFPAVDEAGEGRSRACFDGLSRGQVAAYVRLAGVAETEKLPPIDIPVDLLEEMLSGDRARVQDAVARLDEQEAEKEGNLHRAFRQRLLEAMNNSQQPARVRVSAGEALALVGDPRFRASAWFLPDEPLLGFVEIPAGPFLMGSDKKRDPAADDREVPQHEVELPTYYIARYPVTVAQFRAFVEDSGQKLTNQDALGGLDNHPAVLLTWHEAMAYCDWLTSCLRQWPETPEPFRTLLRQGENGGPPWRVILPSEAEWEKAARGGDGRIYPWGNEFDPQKANTQATGIGAAIAVGCFPTGASPYGLMDMSGNAWEWTRSLWGENVEKPDFKYPYKPDDGRENLEAPDSVLRVLRGGAFHNVEKLARAAVRYWDYPYFLDLNFGLRLAVSTFL